MIEVAAWIIVILAIIFIGVPIVLLILKIIGIIGCVLCNIETEDSFSLVGYGVLFSFLMFIIGSVTYVIA